MLTIKQEKGEDRKTYLARVAIEFLEGNDEGGFIKYDDAECDNLCLADDLRNEFNL